MSENTAYLEDKKYIHKTLEHTAEFVGKLNEKFDDFKLDTAKSIIAIQTKLAIYVALSSVVTGAAVNIIAKALGH